MFLDHSLPDSHGLETFDTGSCRTHDFNNLLADINRDRDMLLGDIGVDNPIVWNGLDQIKEAGQRAASLTRQLLAFSRRQVLEPKVLD